MNAGCNAPYIICTTHTQQAWDEYLASLLPPPQEEVPTDPSLPPEEIPETTPETNPDTIPEQENTEITE